MMKLIVVYFLGILLSRAAAFVPRTPSPERRTRLCVTPTIGDFLTTVDISALSLTSPPGLQEIVLLLTPLSAFAGGAVVQQRRKELTENVTFTKMAMNETQAMISQSSNNFKVRFPLLQE